MEIRISHSSISLIKASLVTTLLIAGGIQAHAQSRKNGDQGQPAVRRVILWNNDLAGAVHFLHELFPDIDPRSKSIILNNLNWKSSPVGTGAFTIYICEPRDVEVQKNSLTPYEIQCPALTLRATFFMSGSPLGPVPRLIMIGRPDIDERWKGTAALLISHPEWSDVQIEDSMRVSGVKYQSGSRREISTLIHNTLNQLGPFLGKLVIDSIDYAGPILTDKSQPGPPAWVVKVHSAGQEKTKSSIRYVLAFNAFDGALDSVTRVEESGCPAIAVVDQPRKSPCMNEK